MKALIMLRITSLSQLGINIFGRSVLFAVALMLSACSTTPIMEGDTPDETVFPAEEVLQKDSSRKLTSIYDPWEGFNRSMYRFNYRFDKYVFLPVVSGYEFIMPEFAQQGVHNFYTNFRQIGTLINSILQGEGVKAVEVTARLLINTTIGVFGLFDWASDMDVPYHEEDFGQTLGVWGMGPGPYLVLPILGPSSLRDGTGRVVDWYAETEIRDDIVSLNREEKIAWGVLDAVDTRANISFRYYETGSPFEYEWVRLLYNTKRQLDIEK